MTHREAASIWDMLGGIEGQFGDENLGEEKLRQQKVAVVTAISRDIFNDYGHVKMMLAYYVYFICTYRENKE